MDILCISNGLAKLDGVPELTMSTLISFEGYTQAGLQEYLNVIIAWERRMLAEGPSVETVRDLDISMDNEHSLEGLQLLGTFCKTGVHNTARTGDGVLLAKEFLYYRILDMFAQVHLTRKAPIEMAKSTFPLMTPLVSEDPSIPGEP
jgi:hypothetical protein